MKVDENFRAIGPPQLLQTQDPASPVPSRAEDGRLIAVGDTLYLVFSDNKERKITKGGFRLYIGRITEEEGIFSVHDITCMADFEGCSPDIREKNWVPFDYEGSLLLSYSLTPHKVFLPVPGTNYCATFCISDTPVPWQWGELRGGTTALPIGDQYLAFFHSVRFMESAHSQGKTVPHYFMGAYTFQGEPPFRLTAISPEPIVAPVFMQAASKPHSGDRKRHYSLVDTSWRVT